MRCPAVQIIAGVALTETGMKYMIRKIREAEIMMKGRSRVYTDMEKENERWALKGKSGRRPLGRLV